MTKRWLIYIGFFVVLLAGFYFFAFRYFDFSQSDLKVINANVQDFSFTDQNGRTVTERSIEGKVYVAEYFFTTCKAICPKMNANMRRVFDHFKSDSGFAILSHTCMPETDNVGVLKEYEYKMLSGDLVQSTDGSYSIKQKDQPYNGHYTLPVNFKTNWLFLTGDKTKLYDLARHSYLIDNNKSDTLQNIADQFIHTQLFALVDKQRRVRGIYDGLKEIEMQKLFKDIKGLLKETAPAQRSMTGFGNTPK